MSKINFPFIIVPTYFFEKGWFDNPKTMSFILWTLKRCQNKAHIVIHHCKELSLEPYEFICGQDELATCTSLTRNEIRHQLFSLTNAGILKKSTNSITNRFTCYIWSKDIFPEHYNQLNHQPTTNRPPTDHHKQENKIVPVLFVKETSKEKEPENVHNLSCPSVVQLSLSLEEKKEQQTSLEMYFEYAGIVIDKQAIRRWLEKYPTEMIVKNIQLMEKSMGDIPNPGGWLETALKGNWAQKEEFRSINREFSIKFKSTHNITALYIHKNYCKDKNTGNDYQYKIDPETFQQTLERKYL